MKRTGEFTLGIIGTIFSALTVLGGLFFIWLGNSQDAMQMIMESVEQDPTFSHEQINASFSFMAGFGWALTIAAVLGVIFGIIATVNIKGNKKPTLAGWMFIIGAVLLGFISIGIGFLPALLFLIAGIMCLARKQQIELEDQYE